MSSEQFYQPKDIQLFVGTEGYRLFNQLKRDNWDNLSSDQKLDLKKQERRSKDPHYINDNKYQRSEKIKFLKLEILRVNKDIHKLIEDINPEEEAKLSEEERQKRKLEFRDNLQLKRAEIKGFQEELKTLRGNRLMSSAYEVIESHKGFNRRQAKAFRKQNKRNKH